MSASSPTDFPDVPSPDEFAELFNGPADALEDKELIQLLNEYFDDAQDARRSGTESRDEAWELNWDAYWGRYDSSYKADWQSREVLPEVANFVDRNAAALTSILVRGEDWHAATDPADPTGRFGKMMTKFNKLLLSHSGTNASGQDVGFGATFSDVVKCANLSAGCLTVTHRKGRVRVDAVDAREVYFDPKGRGLYRVRRYEIDRWTLEELKNEQDSDGESLWKNIDKLQESLNTEAETERQTSSGGNEQGASYRRKPVVLKEYLCTILNTDGELVAKNQLVVMANDQFIVRGPENNPHWHMKDWLIYMPPIQVPFSQYGRSYVEVFRDLANTFIELTNLLIDAAFASSIHSYMIWLDALDDPSQIQDGIAPGTTVTARDTWPAGQDFVREIRTGEFPPALINVWQGIKGELRDGAMLNETTLGQVPPKGDITATEIRSSTSGSSAMMASIAQDYDTRLLGPMLELVFWTGIQIYDPEENPELAKELGDDLSAMLVTQRETIRGRQFKFTASGITSAVDRGQRLQGTMGLLQILGQSEFLAAAFAQKHSVPKLLDTIIDGLDIDASRLEKDEEEIQADERRQAQQRAELASGNQPPGQSGQASPDLRGLT